MDLEEMYERHARQVYLYLLSLSHDAALSEDLTQETFLKASVKIRGSGMTARCLRGCAPLPGISILITAVGRSGIRQGMDHLFSGELMIPGICGSLPVCISCRSRTGRLSGCGYTDCFPLRR